MPLVSVGVPLYRSMRFVPDIVRNLEAVDYPNLEILVSDRHCADGALAVLRERFGHDPRFHFFSATDGLSWVDHYNFLLYAARGEYFVWMPHDDEYGPSYITELVSYLQLHPEAVLAFGSMSWVSLDNEFHPPVGAESNWETPPPIREEEIWTLLTSIQLFLWGRGVPFRGVFRRADVVRNGLHIRPTLDQTGADLYWVFGLSLLGRFGYVPGAWCCKRYHADSTHARWQHDVRHRLSEARTMYGYVNTYSGNGAWRAAGAAFVTAWMLWRIARDEGVPLPDWLVKSTKQYLVGR